jgi:glycosyltransferase involved in cell wall biosynthesis|tara:strand:- start:166 stop:1212 length:1047 start_codon:yes stop_codon:yes gene_type:complete
MFDREVALYERLGDKGVTISFVTYGNADDLNYQKRLPGIEILCNWWRLPSPIYERLLHRFHGKTLESCNLIKTNQMNGAGVALRCAQRWNKPLICRMGYIWSQFIGNENGSVVKIEEFEDDIFSSTDRIVVTTNEMKRDIQERIPESNGKTLVIPNYVETDRFAPDPDKPKEFDILFVGRLSPQKNVSSLLKALQNVDVKAMIIGSGELKSELQSGSHVSSNKIIWKGIVSNNELPNYMNRSSLFILPSYYEGHPKTLIEAMSCGMAVIGADSPGIREIIDHEINGYLCGTDSESIGKAIEDLLSNPGLCQEMGKNARQYAVKNFSLDRIVEIEKSLYQEIIEKTKVV